MAKDIFHEIVKESLLAEGWEITHDGYRLLTELLKDALNVDIATQKLIIATKQTEKIAVEPGRRCGKEFFGQFVDLRFSRGVGTIVDLSSQYRITRTRQKTLLGHSRSNL